MCGRRAGGGAPAGTGTAKKAAGGSACQRRVHVLEYCAPSLNVSEEPEYLAVIIAWDSRAAEHVADDLEASGYEDAKGAASKRSARKSEKWVS